MSPHGGDRPYRRAPGRTLSTARHVLQALEIIARHPRGIPIKALARQLDISLSSGYYLVSSLREQGFVEPSPTGSGLYTLGPKFAELYRGYVAASLQPERLQPFLCELRDRASARAYAALWRDGDLEVVEIRGRRGSRELPDVTKGFRGAAHALALGKVYLASLPRSQWPRYLRGPTYPRYTPATITTPEALAQHLRTVRDTGLAFDLQEYAIGSCCIAVPLRRGPDNDLVASVGVAVPARRFTAERNTLTGVIQAIAAEASAELNSVAGPDAPRPHPLERAEQARAHSKALHERVARAAEAVANTEQEHAQVHRKLADQGGPRAATAREHADTAEDLAAKEQAEAERLRQAKSG
jgi:IclR family acetate operon transcriptional repressor